MSFATELFQGDAQDVTVKFKYKLDHEREQRVLAVITEAVEKLSAELGGYLAISATGHINDYQGGVGDNLNLQINSLLPPAKPVQDAGLDAAGGSARNFPPEASTAAPATEDNSPPATQEPVPQSIDAVPPTVVEEASTDPSPSSEPEAEPLSVADTSTPADDQSSPETPVELAPPAPSDAEPVASLQDGQTEAVQPSETEVPPTPDGAAVTESPSSPDTEAPDASIAA